MTAAIRILLRSSERSYQVVTDVRLSEIGRDIHRTLDAEKYFIVTDSNVRRLYAETIFKSLRSHTASCHIIAIPAGEATKIRRTKETIENKILALGATRASAIVSVGGGVVGDIAGFVAATMLRGVPYVQIPTTLLAQVDSSVGGKVGVDHPLGKNLIGAFYHPRRVYIDVSTLRTLRPSEFANGMAEVIKYAAILDVSLLGSLERHRNRILRGSKGHQLDIVRRCIGWKKHVVEIDERESNYRRILNFGHTFGHAIESVSKFRISHGRAVAIGMAAEARISASVGLLPWKDVDRLTSLLRSYGLPTDFPRSMRLEDIASATMHDKKMKGGVVEYTLLRRLGRGVTGQAVSVRQLSRALSR